jgi:Holliday junction resolvase-like predicted endonuclease
MNEFFPDRAGVLAKAARLLESSGLTVLDRDCEAGGYRMDLVAAAGGGVLVVAEVTVTEPDGVRAAAADIPGERMLELMRAGAAWMSAHPGDYCEFRISGVVLSADDADRAAPQQGWAR